MNLLAKFLGLIAWKGIITHWFQSFQKRFLPAFTSRILNLPIVKNLHTIS